MPTTLPLNSLSSRISDFPPALIRCGKPRQGFYISAPKKFLIAILPKIECISKTMYNRTIFDTKSKNSYSTFIRDKEENKVGWKSVLKCHSLRNVKLNGPCQESARLVDSPDMLCHGNVCQKELIKFLSFP